MSKQKRGPYKSRRDPDKLGTGGIRVRQHRLAKGWTVATLAEKAGLSEGMISDIENQSGGFSDLTLAKLANALGTTVGALFDVDPREGAEKPFWPIWEALDERGRQRVQDYAEGLADARKR